MFLFAVRLCMCFVIIRYFSLYLDTSFLPGLFFCLLRVDWYQACGHQC